MGWGSGSEVMSKIIARLPGEVPDDDQRREVYKIIIDAMEDNDWDTQNDCEGEDDAFDKALRELHPDWYEDEDE